MPTSGRLFLQINVRSHRQIRCRRKIIQAQLLPPLASSKRYELSCDQAQKAHAMAYQINPIAHQPLNHGFEKESALDQQQQPTPEPLASAAAAQGCRRYGRCGGGCAAPPQGLICASPAVRALVRQWLDQPPLPARLNRSTQKCSCRATQLGAGFQALQPHVLQQFGAMGRCR